ncbi:hypothetical protein GCM10027589_48090 [Actinocorallia lasiicapitis]
MEAQTTKEDTVAVRTEAMRRGRRWAVQAVAVVMGGASPPETTTGIGRAAMASATGVGAFLDFGRCRRSGFPA